MTRIAKIARLRHPGVLRDFNWPMTLPTFGRYNLIYGWNGTGKTTISNLLRALEQRKSPEGEVALVIDNVPTTGGSFGEATVPVRVFNREFIAESVFPVGGGEVPPIFVFGKESAEKQARVEQMKNQRDRAIAEQDTASQEKARAEKTAAKHCVDRATVIREALRSGGNNPYNNYDRARYRQRASAMVAAGDRGAHLLVEAAREQLFAQSRAIPKSKISEIHCSIPELQKLFDAAELLLRKSVTSSAIAALKSDSALSSWIREGLGLHQHRSSTHCLFCEQSMPDGRIGALQAHFSAEYEQLIRDIDGLVTKLETISRSASSVSLPSRAEFYEDLVADYDLAKGIFHDAAHAVGSFIGSLVDALHDKKRHVFEAVPLTATVPSIPSSVDEVINQVIRRHNVACIDFDNLVSSARAKLEGNYVAMMLDEYQSLVGAVESSQLSLDKAGTETRRLLNEIQNLEREIIEHRKPAEDLNQDLHKYLGHAELQLEVKDTGYVISRNGVVAQSLSEGEKTAIALLYFLKSLEDRSFDLSRGVVVLDDPVSSLDANALFLAFGFIKRCTDGVAQLFVLTHNFAMFRQVRNWFHHTKGQNKRDVTQRPSRFYMMECSLTHDGRRSSIVALDPLLEQFESEYHYLFARIYRRAQANGQAGLEANYVFPNMARRLLETFLAFRRPQIAGELRQKLQSVDFDEARKLRVLRFLHTHSHADEIAEPEHDPSLLGETRAVLSDLLELMEQEDPAHYKAMVAVVDRDEVEEETE